MTIASADMDMGFQATMRAVAEISYNTNYLNATSVNTISKPAEVQNLMRDLRVDVVMRKSSFNCSMMLQHGGGGMPLRLLHVQAWLRHPWETWEMLLTMLLNNKTDCLKYIRRTKLKIFQT